MNVEVGREYKTRGGWKAKVISDDGSGEMQFRVEHDDGSNTIIWHHDCGSVWKYLPKQKYDLISYWVEESKAGEWIGWNGGECPVHPDTVVQYQLENETRIEVEGQGDLHNTCAGDLEWRNAIPEGHNIIAYRVIKEHKESREFWVFWSEERMDWLISDNENHARNSHPKTHRHPVIHVREVI